MDKSKIETVHIHDNMESKINKTALFVTSAI